MNNDNFSVPKGPCWGIPRRRNTRALLRRRVRNPRHTPTSPNSPEKHPQTTREPSQDDPKMSQKWSKIDPKMVQFDPKMDPPDRPKAPQKPFLDPIFFE